MKFLMQLIQRKAINSPTWSIKGGEKGNVEAQQVERRIQQLLKPGDGKIGIAYEYNDAQ